MSVESLRWSEIWLEPDRERSRIAFSPRRGIIVNVFQTSHEKESILVKLSDPVIVWRPLPTRLSHVFLRYPGQGDDSIHRTFKIGLSVALVYQLSHKILKTTTIPGERDMSRLGTAIIRPWPLPSAAEIRQRIADEKQSHST